MGGSLSNMANLNMRCPILATNEICKAGCQDSQTAPAYSVYREILLVRKGNPYRRLGKFPVVGAFEVADDYGVRIISLNRIMLTVKTNLSHMTRFDGIQAVFKAVDNTSFVSGQTRNINRDTMLDNTIDLSWGERE